MFVLEGMGQFVSVPPDCSNANACRDFGVELLHLNLEGDASQRSSLSAGSTQLSSQNLLAGSAGVAALSTDGGSLCSGGRGASSLGCLKLSALLPASSSEGNRLGANTTFTAASSMQLVSRPQPTNIAHAVSCNHKLTSVV